MLPVFLTALSSLLLAVIVYFAVSPRSSRALRRAAVIALVLIALSLGVSAMLLLSEPRAVPGNILAESAEETPPVKKGANGTVLIVLVILILFMFFVAFLAVREEKRRRESRAREGEGDRK